MYTHGSESRNGHGGHKGHGGHGRHSHAKILGTTTIGERGQLVIPAEAREALDIKPGDKFVVFAGHHNSSVTLMKADVISSFADAFMGKSERYEKIAQDILGQMKDSEEEEQQETTAPESPQGDAGSQQSEESQGTGSSSAPTPSAEKTE